MFIAPDRKLFMSASFYFYNLKPQFKFFNLSLKTYCLLLVPRMGEDALQNVQNVLKKKEREREGFPVRSFPHVNKCLLS